MEVRRATPDEADALTAIAREAKACWGYSSELLLGWDSDLVVTPQFIEANTVYCAVSEGEILGFCGVRAREGDFELEHMWVRPEHLRSGIGRALMARVIEHLREAGAASLQITSDPNAEDFYLKMGAVRVGEVESVPSPRRIPLLKLNLSDPTREGGGSVDPG